MAQFPKIIQKVKLAQNTTEHLIMVLHYNNPY